jgi:hypothetical protein
MTAERPQLPPAVPPGPAVQVIIITGSVSAVGCGFQIPAPVTTESTAAPGAPAISPSSVEPAAEDTRISAATPPKSRWRSRVRRRDTVLFLAAIATAIAAVAGTVVAVCAWYGITP